MTTCDWCNGTGVVDEPVVDPEEQAIRQEYRTWLLMGRVGDAPPKPTYTEEETARSKPFIDALMRGMGLKDDER